MSKTDKIDAQAEREFHEMLNSHSATVRQQAAENHQRMREATLVMEKQIRAKKRRKAVHRFIVRVLTCLSMWLVIYIAQCFDLIAWQFALAVGAGVLVWLALWIGAFIQFINPEGGIFYG